LKISILSPIFLGAVLFISHWYAIDMQRMIDDDQKEIFAFSGELSRLNDLDVQVRKSEDELVDLETFVTENIDDMSEVGQTVREVRIEGFRKSMASRRASLKSRKRLVEKTLDTAEARRASKQLRYDWANRVRLLLLAILAVVLAIKAKQRWLPAK